MDTYKVTPRLLAVCRTQPAGFGATISDLFHFITTDANHYRPDFPAWLRDPASDLFVLTWNKGNLSAIVHKKKGGGLVWGACLNTEIRESTLQQDATRVLLVSEEVSYTPNENVPAGTGHQRASKLKS